MKKAIFCWSGGKDSAYALHKILSAQQYDVKYLLTTINQQYQRISMHGVREALLDQQAQAIGIPLLKMYVSEGSNAEYEQQMNATLLQAKAEGITHVVFGDIFLADLRAYREKNLAQVGLEAIFPLWEMNTAQLIQDFIAQDFKTITCCINDAYFDASWVGKDINAQFIAGLPVGVDPCGENGEYHTFCYNAPYFKHPIVFSVGETVYKPLTLTTTDDVCPSTITTKGFWFCDLIPQ